MKTDRPFRDQISDHLPALRSYARSLRRNRDQADDLEQDCIERALSRSHLYEEGTNLRAWLFTIMRNIFITHGRRDAFRQRSTLIYGARSLGTIPARQDVLVELKESIALTKTLTTFERRVVEHMCLDDLGYDETSRLTGQPIGTIKSRLSRARQRLRDAITSPDRDGALPNVVVARSTADRGGAELQSAA
jgi:RNA polymerase sigma-70 factor (ECF subfamily)